MTIEIPWWLERPLVIVTFPFVFVWYTLEFLWHVANSFIVFFVIIPFIRWRRRRVR